MKHLFGLLLMLGLLISVSQRTASSETSASISLQHVVVSGLSKPVEITHAGDGSNRLFIVEQVGKIRVIKNGQLLPTPFLDLSAVVSSGGEQGLLGLAFHPQYETNGYFYVYYTDRVEVGNSVVARYRVSAANADLADPATKKQLLYVKQPYANHNAGRVAFGQEGYLYIALGDGGSGGDPQENAQNLGNLLGKILRVDVDGGDPYAVPSTNPFFNQTDRRGEIWAYGLRNPWKFSFDRANGDLYIGDVGQNQFEEIDLQAGGTPGGINFGWRCMEGATIYSTDPPCDSPAYLATLTGPVAVYDRSDGVSVTGGYVYRGKLFPDLLGRYFYADYATGKIWSFSRTYAPPGSPQTTPPVLEASAGFYVSSFGEDEDGELYLADYLGGRVIRLESANGPVPVLSGTMSISSQTANPGEHVTITITARNDGGSAGGLVLTSPLPNGLSYGPGSLSLAGPGTASFSSDILSWAGGLATGETLAVTFDAQVNFTLSSRVVRAELSGPGAAPLRLAASLWSPKSKLSTSAANFFLPGTQPGGLSTPLRTSIDCDICHSAPIYDRWRGSAMAQAARDPLMWSALAISNAFAPGSGEFCLRCHASKGWLEGRSTPPDGSALLPDDLNNGVACLTCHRMVDHVAPEGDDAEILAALQHAPPGVVGSAMLVIDPQDVRRGPFLFSPPLSYHSARQTALLGQSGDAVTRARLCGSCHNVSNPLLSFNGTEYLPNPAGQPAPSFEPDGPQRPFPLERTFDEWRLSQYANGGVYAPQFAGSKPDGIVETCQDCHMTRSAGKAADDAFQPVLRDCGAAGCLPQHNFLGANIWLPDLLLSPDWRLNAQGEAAYLKVNAATNRDFLTKAATMDLELSPAAGGQRQALVTVTNQTGHKLPTGYPEGRRMWINLRAYDAEGRLVYESGAYDPSTGVLAIDADTRVYEAKLGISSSLAALSGLPEGESFFFALNNTWLKDNRIPPRGYTRSAFNKDGLRSVGADYADGQYFDQAVYTLPSSAEQVVALLYYQVASKEYIDFLRQWGGADGEVLGSLWDTSRSSPVLVTGAAILKNRLYLPLIGR